MDDLRCLLTRYCSYGFYGWQGGPFFAIAKGGELRYDRRSGAGVMAYLS